jgi:hypothetical protein
MLHGVCLLPIGCLLGTRVAFTLIVVLAHRRDRRVAPPNPLGAGLIWSLADVMNLVIRLVVPIAVFVFVAGCESSTGDCSLLGVPAVRANITDSVTGRPLAYRSSLIIRDGAYVDSVPYASSAADSATVGFIDAGIGRAGTYSVTVRRDGSAVWKREGVRPSVENRCLLKSAVVNARLQPAS